MIKNYFKIAWRNIFRNKLFATINIVGLAMGIAAFLLLMEYISLEKSVNNFHTNIGNMYRLINEDPAGRTWPQVEPGWALQAKQRFSEITSYCRFEEGTAQGIVSNQLNNDQTYRENRIGYAEGNFFNFFSFPLKAGTAAALNKPNVVFISESTSKKYFGTKPAIGQTLQLANQFGNVLYTVEGIYADMGNNSDIQYDMVFSLETLKTPANLNGNSWAALDNLSSQYINTFFTLSKGVNAIAFEKKLTAMRNELKKDKDGVQFHLQAFSNVHLGTSLNDHYQTSGNLKYVYLLGAIAFLILLIAWFNYVNLSTANSFKRASEVGIRKVVGASKNSLLLQFMGESLLVNLMGFLLAIILIIVMQPLFNQLINKTVSLQTISTTTTWLFAAILLLAGSILSGAYTAVSLSRFNPVETLKGKINKTAKGVLLRKSLVVSQFVISIVLIIATVLIYSQLNYMQNQQLGINANQLLVIRGPEMGKDSSFKNRQSAFWDQIAQQSFVKDYCTSGTVPSSFYNFATSGFTQPNSKKNDDLKTYSFAIIGDRYLKTYEIKLAAGRNFTPAECAVEWNDNSKVLMNETAIKQLGFTSNDQALNTKVQWDERALDVIGVVKDYHHTSLQNSIDPMVFYPQNNNAYFTVRLTADNIKDKMASLENLYKKSFSGNPFDYFFVDENYNKSYEAEMQYGRMFSIAAIWAIFIACLGLFGLTTFTVESRIKEIGVRKVLGASVQSIVTLLSKDFLQLILIAFLIAVPIAWYGMHKWLQDFAYKIDISWGVFAWAAFVVSMIALVTVSFQSIRAALMNPVRSLKSE